MRHSDFREPAASEACDIAFNFLTLSGAVRDEFEAAVFLVEYLTRMVDHGHINKILMANREISAYQNEIRACERQASLSAPRESRRIDIAADRQGG
jgi:hypothetical protein